MWTDSSRRNKMSYQSFSLQSLFRFRKNMFEFFYWISSKSGAPGPLKGLVQDKKYFRDKMCAKCWSNKLQGRACWGWDHVYELFYRISCKAGLVDVQIKCVRIFDRISSEAGLVEKDRKHFSRRKPYWFVTTIEFTNISAKIAM